MKVHSMNNAGDILLGNSFDENTGTLIESGVTYLLWDRNKNELVKLNPEMRDDVYRFYYLADKTKIPVLGYMGSSLRTLEIAADVAPFHPKNLRGIAINSNGDLFGSVENIGGPLGTDKNLLFLRTGEKTIIAKRWDLKNPNSDEELSHELWNKIIKYST